MSSEYLPCLVSIKQLPNEFEVWSHIVFSASQFFVGRALNNEIVLTQLSISRTHCKFLQQADGTWAFQDLSSYGCILNGSKIEKEKSYTLQDSDVIQFDIAGEFVYKFRNMCNHQENAAKKRKMDTNENNNHNLDMIEHTKQKFEASQTFEVEKMENKIKNAQLQSMQAKAERKRLECFFKKEIEYLNNKYLKEVENLTGEKTEVEKQRANLNEQKLLEVKQCEEDMKLKVSLMEEKISEQAKNEKKLQLENKILSDRLQQERYEFERLLFKESTSRQEMFDKLEAKLQHLEEERCKEKEQLELEKKEMENIKTSKEKELKELEEKIKLVMEARESEILSLQNEIQQKVSENQAVKIKTEQEYQTKLEEMQSVTQLLKERVDQMETVESEIKTLQSEKLKIEHRLQENTATCNATVIQLEAELAKVRNELDIFESKKKELEENLRVARNELATGDPNIYTERSNILTEFNQLMESELQCTICADLLITATTLNCSHTFCHYCIEQWKKKKNECPMCRSPIVSQCRSLMFDSFISKMVENLAPDVQEKRQQILKDRENEQAAIGQAKTPGTNGSAHSEERAQRTNPSFRPRGSSRNTSTATQNTTFSGPAVQRARTRRGTLVAVRPTAPPVNYLARRTVTIHLQPWRREREPPQAHQPIQTRLRVRGVTRAHISLLPQQGRMQ